MMTGRYHCVHKYQTDVMFYWVHTVVAGALMCGIGHTCVLLMYPQQLGAGCHGDGHLFRVGSGAGCMVRSCGLHAGCIISSCYAPLRLAGLLVPSYSGGILSARSFLAVSNCFVKQILVTFDQGA